MPAHVHAITGSETAKIILDGPEGDPIIEFATDKISPGELRWLKKEVADHRDRFMMDMMELSKFHGDPNQEESD